ncbi:MAG TPA: nitrilase-related carbon-nitrogen hydrolase [Allosphingosinicella sp.]|jgi:apolipoprotein N-acyltransferase
MLALGYANYPLWWAAWLAPAPAVAAVLLAPPRLRVAVGLVVGLASGALSFGYHVTTGSVTAAIVIALAYALGWAGTLRLTARAAERWPAMVATLVLPASWAAIDTLLIHFSPHGSVGSLAYSQAGVLPVLQVASLGGVPAVTFVLLLPGSLAGLKLAQWLGRADLRGLSRAALVTGVVVAGVLLFGWWRLDAAPGGSGAKVAMIASDRPSPGGRTWERFAAEYGAAVDRAARPGVTLLLPEAVIRTDPANSERVARVLAAIARNRNATLVVGILVEEGEKVTNRALVAMPDGRLAWYVKQHLVPGLERGTPGDRNLLVASPVAGTGVAICKDMHFPTLGRSYAGDGARLMLVLANDFDVDDRMAAAVTALRGIEGGYAVARAARQGMSFISDPYGRVVAERRSGAATGTLLARVPSALSTPTLYARVGDLFGWTCVAAFLGLVLAARRRRYRRAAAGGSELGTERGRGR